MSLLKNRKGMTLIEIMIVLAIIGGIAALLLPNITGQLDKSKAKEAKIQLTQIVNALSMYYTDCGKYPQTLEGLTTADPNCSNWGPQPYYTKKLQDPFGHDLVYELEGGEYSLKSLGKDGREGGSGFDKDITLDDLN
ncbi:type II secretion system major pseudopilin GspG [Bdellovibrio bacteriovorus]|uniref:Type II secretion system core protein G n=3 Tax=Bdellovibrio bacteriovorus TaxID=959 RepID=Q6MMN5_BDEBA|nr:type II secretion system major pseudopilin GspG [Bdellovibrio bacteriovorus]AFY01279.1 general secretion pathway protein G precursor [Bdellovibrio bacteriovorus str. Tiberius]AHZ84140.1 general secretion pathway protein GspG [Bdellovibrio bacteriovorus]ASD64040.1 type II secretion system protein GspG [Bdellovibrio bacteriovorus]CAE79469.1 General secretion pathway protein G precursor [Bdellovibrio bacteriovorus HD100]BEV68023.1 Type II secretion system protein G [Bdellovibrio bacteriovorus]